ncbi:MAG: hypothetical protein EOO46_20980, partial [Flavobacterium sp.]
MSIPKLIEGFDSEDDEIAYECVDALTKFDSTVDSYLIKTILENRPPLGTYRCLAVSRKAMLAVLTLSIKYEDPLPILKRHPELRSYFFAMLFRNVALTERNYREVYKIVKKNLQINKKLYPKQTFIEYQYGKQSTITSPKEYTSDELTYLQEIFDTKMQELFPLKELKKILNKLDSTYYKEHYTNLEQSIGAKNNNTDTTTQYFSENPDWDSTRPIVQVDTLFNSIIRTVSDSLAKEYKTKLENGFFKKVFS